MTDETILEELNTALYKKVFAEQEKYRNWLLCLKPAEILKHTYEYTVREDLVLALEEFNIDAEQAAALLASPTPLSDIFSAFEKTETEYMEDLRNCICQRADGIIRNLHPQLYLHNAAYAVKHNELAQYRDSYRANIACKNAIESAIDESYHDNCLSDIGAKRVLQLFGSKRTQYVLANTIQSMDWDKRISSENKMWAQMISFDKDSESDRCSFLIGRSHPGLLNLFVNQLRRLEEKQLSQPSLLSRLQEAKDKAAAQQSAPQTKSRENAL